MSSLRNLLESNGFVRIHLRLTVSYHYSVTANINGKNGSFIVDTGASSSCVDAQYIDHFSLAVQDTETQATGAGASNIDMQIALENSLRFGHWHKSNVQIIVMDLSHVNTGLQELNAAEVHGILGADFLKKSRAVIDYGRNCMYVK